MNTLWLAVFGAPVARRLGTGPFLALFALGAAAGALLHVWLFPASATPLVGASAAVSALTGAAVRFVFSVPFNPAAMGRDDVVRALPALTLAEAARNRMALAFTGFWFLTNWLFGAGVVPLAGADQSVAWQAHVGGFLAGLLLFPLLDRGTRRRRDIRPLASIATFVADLLPSGGRRRADIRARPVSDAQRSLPPRKRRAKSRGDEHDCPAHPVRRRAARSSPSSRTARWRRPPG